MRAHADVLNKFSRIDKFPFSAMKAPPLERGGYAKIFSVKKLTVIENSDACTLFDCT